VIGVPDELLGEKMRAFVVPREGRTLDPPALAKALRRALPTYKVPGEFLILEALPKNESGKVMKQRLRERPA
jgi:long-chain acyl-CoA synthetase